MGKLKFETGRFERLSYGGFFLGQNIIYMIQLQFLLYFYTDYVGLKVLHTGILFIIAKIWDAVNDPIMGAIVDKCNFKKGKYLPWLKVVTYILPLTLVFLFIDVNLGYGGKLMFAYFTFILWDMVYTVSDAPIFSLSTVMTKSTFERDTLMSYGRVAAALAAISTAAFMVIKVGLGMTWTVGVYALIAFLFMLPLQFVAKERVKYIRSSDISFMKIFGFLFKNKYLLLYYLGYLAIGATNSLQIIAVYFADSNLHDETMLTVIMAIVILPMLVVSPFLPRLIKKFGKRKITVVCCVITIALSLIQFFTGYDQFVLFLALTAARVLFMQVPLLIYGMFTADCIEYGAYVNGERSEGISFSVQTLITKISEAICLLVCLGLLGASGYLSKSDVQPASALSMIWAIMTLLPVIGYLIMIVVMYFYKLDEKEVARIIEINRQKLDTTGE